MTAYCRSLLPGKKIEESQEGSTKRRDRGRPFSTAIDDDELLFENEILSNDCFEWGLPAEKSENAQKLGKALE